MQKLTLTLFALMIFLCGCDSKTKEVSALSEDKIYFFYYNECPYCHNAIEYIDKKYPELNMAMINIYVGNGFELFKECGQKFNLGNSIGPHYSVWETNISWAGRMPMRKDLMNMSNHFLKQTNNKTNS